MPPPSPASDAAALPAPAPLPTSAAAERNKQPILEVLRALLPAEARVLEVASGTGQHAAHFAAAQAQWRWQPSDGDAGALPTIAARCAGLRNVALPLHLDLLAPAGAGAAPPPAGGSFDAMFVANLLHISPWATCAALMRLAAAQLRDGGRLVVYGPFAVAGEPLAPGNRAFGADLRARDPRWGLRELGEVQAEAARAGLVFEQRVAMPANNLTLVWRRPAGVRATPRAATQVRPLSASDASTYRALMLEAYRSAADAFTSTAEEREVEPMAWWERRIAAADGLSESFGAFTTDGLAGTVALEYSAKPKTRHSALLLGMYVRPAARGQGVAAALLHAAIAAARARGGVRMLRLTVTEGNGPAIELYRSFGFIAWGTEPEALLTPGGYKGKVHMTMALEVDEHA